MLVVITRSVAIRRHPHIERITGEPVLVLRRADGSAFLMIAIEAHRGSIATIRALANPAKLARL